MDHTSISSDMDLFKLPCKKTKNFASNKDTKNLTQYFTGKKKFLKFSPSAEDS